MSQRIEIDTDLLGRIQKILFELSGDFEAARVRVANTIGNNLEEGELTTQIGKMYGKGVRPGAYALAALLDLIRKELEGAAGNTYGVQTVFDDANANANDVSAPGGNGGKGGRR